jgi:hypothetical protein
MKVRFRPKWLTKLSPIPESPHAASADFTTAVDPVVVRDRRCDVVELAGLSEPPPDDKAVN